ncbi:glycosyl transferase family 2 [Neptunitalea chrysea]|uniref:Glycosyl transferase family 2 n=2 Tax=Neptunitalea chrysea TaxID=1647581 RepID=A0A9W6ETJ0_9FLAO|nr:glycosyl transferase family 2 [Neptunitalea chrysea]
MNSVLEQALYPNEILIVDGSADDDTKNYLESDCDFLNLVYYKAPEEHRGLTKQRNYGISKLGSDMDVVCFLDDDTVLEKEYFYETIKVFKTDMEITGVGGVAVNENRWEPKQSDVLYNPKKYYEFEGYVCKEGLRNVIRNYLGLSSTLAPGKLPAYSHGRTMGYPLTGKYYEVDLLVGMSMAFRKEVLDGIEFSSYFEGYGLYEDADFSLRALKFGKNVIATSARLAHYHDASGRPNKYKYGKMVILNGWYIWRVKNPSPSLKAIFKWYSITWLLIAIRVTNIAGSKSKEAFTEVLGRIVGCLLLIFKKPTVDSE